MIDLVVQRGEPVESILVVCDNASRQDTVAQLKVLNILRLGPCSPMLNPIETVWSTLKADVKRINRIPVVNGLGIIEQRVFYLKLAITSTLGQITYLWSQAIIYGNKF